jgi:hypothetical protein
MSVFNSNLKTFIHDFFQRTTSVRLCGNLKGSMLDYDGSVGLC